MQPLTLVTQYISWAESVASSRKSSFLSMPKLLFSSWGLLVCPKQLTVIPLQNMHNGDLSLQIKMLCYVVHSDTYIFLVILSFCCLSWLLLIFLSSSLSPLCSTHFHDSAPALSSCIFFSPSLIFHFLFFVDSMNHTGCSFILPTLLSSQLLFCCCPRWLTGIDRTCQCVSHSVYPSLTHPFLSPFPMSCLGEWWRPESWPW